jgi:hypothetical protein
VAAWPNHCECVQAPVSEPVRHFGNSAHRLARFLCLVRRKVNQVHLTAHGSAKWMLSGLKKQVKRYAYRSIACQCGWKQWQSVGRERLTESKGTRQINTFGQDFSQQLSKNAPRDTRPLDILLSNNGQVPFTSDYAKTLRS